MRDYARITQVPRVEVDSWLKQEVKESGGDWDHGRYHLFIGFSTGHFGQDPVNAIAMRRLAFSIVNNSLSTGDRVTPFAWEMSTWNVGETVILTDKPESRAQFVDAVPYAPRSGSQGGHDIERVLFETITKAVPKDEAGSAIVLLLTNSNASQAPSGQRADLFGSDNPQLTEALRQGDYRVPPARKDFQLRAGSQPVTVDVTAVFPRKLVALPGAPDAARYPTFARETWQPAADRPQKDETLPNPTIAGAAKSGPAAQSPPRAGSFGWIWLAVAAVIIVGGLLVWRAMSQPATPARRNAQPAAAVSPQTVQIPGSLTVQIGAAEQIVQPLTTGSRWSLLRDPSGVVTLVDAAAPKTADGEPAAQAGTPLARLDFDEQRNLRVAAEDGAQFVELNGPDPSRLDSRRLMIAPGKKAFCRIIPAGSPTKTRFEVAYNTSQKGNRA